MVGGIVLACSARADASSMAPEDLLDVLVLLTFAVEPVTVATRMIRLGAPSGRCPSRPRSERAGGHPRR